MTRTKAGAPVRLAVDALLVPDAHGECSAVVHLFRDDYVPAYRGTP
jgi:hypothetical protein